MNITHLGDALDYWKGSILNRLRNDLIDLRVVPMLTDFGRRGVIWSHEQFALYADLLCVDPKIILLKDEQFIHSGRIHYFSNPSLSGDSDLFLDPDTGIEPPGSLKGKHVALSDLQRLLERSQRLILIYQHAQRGGMDNELEVARERMKRVRDFSKKENKSHPWLAATLCCGAVSMFVVSRDEKRFERLHSKITSLLGPCSTGAGGAQLRLLTPA